MKVSASLPYVTVEASAESVYRDDPNAYTEPGFNPLDYLPDGVGDYFERVLWRGGSMEQRATDTRAFADAHPDWWGGPDSEPGALYQLTRAAYDPAWATMRTYEYIEPIVIDNVTKVPEVISDAGQSVTTTIENAPNTASNVVTTITGTLIQGAGMVGGLVTGLWR
jgi:hypothetical protein